MHRNIKYLFHRCRMDANINNNKHNLKFRLTYAKLHYHHVLVKIPTGNNRCFSSVLCV